MQSTVLFLLFLQIDEFETQRMNTQRNISTPNTTIKNKINKVESNVSQNRVTTLSSPTKGLVKSRPSSSAARKSDTKTLFTKITTFQQNICHSMYQIR